MKKKIKVLQVIPKLGYGGAETGCYDLAHFLPEQGCKSYIITSGGELLKYVDNKKVKIYKAPVHSKNPILSKFVNKLDLLYYEFLHERNMLFGTVDYIINKIEEMQRELNLQNLKVWSNFPDVKHEDCMKSIKLFSEKIIPHFKSKEKSRIKAAS